MTPYTIIIPHYKSKITAYTVHKILQHSKRKVHIIVVDNSNGEGIEYLNPYAQHITLLSYPPNLMQSHGLAYDYAMEVVETEWFICMESDSYPTQDNWLDYYDNLIDKGYDAAGSLLTLSGGLYMHPAGALYKRSVWEEAKHYVRTIEYAYFPNMIESEGFDCHTMVRADVLVNFLDLPHLYGELAKGYKGKDKKYFLQKLEEYRPIAESVFHNGMGNAQESIHTFTLRSIHSDPYKIMQDNEDDVILRIGFEPGQFLCYWMLANDKRLFYIPTEIKWLKGRQNQQQEYTLTDNGVRHEWGISAYHKCDAELLQDIVEFKAKKVEELYNSIL